MLVAGLYWAFEFLYVEVVIGIRDVGGFWIDVRSYVCFL